MLAFEMEGSLLLFLVLSVTAGYTSFWRRTYLISTTLYYFESEVDRYKCIFCFFSGALLADFSLTMRGQTAGLRRVSRNTPQWLEVVSKY